MEQKHNASRKCCESGTHKVEILHHEKDQLHGEVRHIRLKEKANAAQRAAGNHQRVDRPILKITPRIDQRIDGVPKVQVEQDPTRREVIANLPRQVLQSADRAKLME